MLFYKHPLEIFVNTIISALVLFPLLGCSVISRLVQPVCCHWRVFYHANVKTPHWLRYLVQTPELHSIHHQNHVHTFNFADIPVWDRIFGTYRDATDFTARCGFPDGAEQRLADMLAFKDVYERDYA